MKTLLVSATEMEVKEVLANFFEQESAYFYQSPQVDLLISGIGMMETSFRLTQLLNSLNYKHIINVGIAGSYQSEFKNGSLVEVDSEQYGDLGAEAKDGDFLTLEEIGLSLPITFSKGKIAVEPYFKELSSVDSITVNTVAGTENTIAKRRQQFNPDIENMEGLAVFRVAKEFGIPVNQVRCISNPVTPRNRELWEIDKAISNLNQFITNQIMGSIK